MKKFLLIEAQKFWEIHLAEFGVNLPLDVVQPLGLLQLASIIRVKDEEADVRILDLRLMNNDFSTLPDMLKKYDPEFVGFRVTSRDSLFANDIIRTVRDTLPRAVLVAGGPHVSAWKAKVMEEAPLDFAVFGEGEVTLEDLLSRLEEGGGYEKVPGLIFRDASGHVTVNGPRGYIQNLDSLPLPAWDLIDHERYFEKMYFPHIPAYLNARREIASIFTSRACPYGCTFCHSIFGKKFRAQSPAKVVSEIEFLYTVFGIRQFDFRDDIFNFDRKRVIDICNLIIEKGLDIRMTFPNGLRGDIMDEELVLKLKEAGMFRCTYALETASPRLQKMIRKNIGLDRLREIIRFTSAQDIIIRLFVMIGFPTETKEELEMTREFVLDKAIDFILLHSVNPFEGTEMAEALRQDGVDIEDFRDKFDYLSVKFSVCEVSPQDLQQFRDDLTRTFFDEKRMLEIRRKLLLHSNL